MNSNLDYYPLVSVIITTYKRNDMLKRAIDSVLSQTYPNIELIICDDFPDSDVESKILPLYSSSNINITYKKNTVNKGACYSRNVGIEIAKGEFIAGLDDDDEFTPIRISLLVKNYDPSYSCITSNTLVKTKSNEYSLFKKAKVVKLKDMLWDNALGTQVLVEKNRLLCLDGFDLNLTSAQDADMWIRLIQEYGPALRLQESEYILHTEHDEERISCSENKLLGMMLNNKKHYHLKTRSQQLYSKLKYSYWKNGCKFKFRYFLLLRPQMLLYFINKIVFRNW